MARFTWQELTPQSGIRQDVPEFAPHYTQVENLRWDQMGWRRDWGTAARGTISTVTTYYVKNAYHARFSSDAHLLVAIAQDSANTMGIYKYSNTDTWTKDASFPFNTTEYPDMLMFAGELIMMDGDQVLKAVTGGTVSTVTTAPLGRFGAVHANRLVVGGVNGSRHIFYPSAVRDATTFDLADGVVVTAPGGDQLTNLGALGKLLIAQTDSATLAFQLSSSNPRDWDQRQISGQVGCSSHRAYVEIERGRGDNLRHYAFFWSNFGPYMLVSEGGTPVLVELWRPIREFVLGNTFKGLSGMNIETAWAVMALYVPEFDEIRFGLRQSGAAGANDVMACVNVESAIQFALGQIDAPWWRLRTWTGADDTPYESMAAVRMDTLERPSAEGRIGSWGFARRAFQLDKASLNVDVVGSEPMPFKIVRQGYASIEDGQLLETKLPQRFELLASVATGSPTATVTLQRHTGDQAAQSQVIDLKTTGGTEGNVRPFRTNFGSVDGQIIDLTIAGGIYINSDFQLAGWHIDGLIEERR